MKFLTITFDRPVQNPLKPQGIYQSTHSAPVDIQVEDSGRATLTAPDGVRVVVQGIGFHGVPDVTHEMRTQKALVEKKESQLQEALDLGLKSPRADFVANDEPFSTAEIPSEPTTVGKPKRGKGKP